MFPLLLINVITASLRNSGAHRAHTLGPNPADRSWNRWSHVQKKKESLLKLVKQGVVCLQNHICAWNQLRQLKGHQSMPVGRTHAHTHTPSPVSLRNKSCIPTGGMQHDDVHHGEVPWVDRFQHICYAGHEQDPGHNWPGLHRRSKVFSCTFLLGRGRTVVHCRRDDQNTL